MSDKLNAFNAAFGISYKPAHKSIYSDSIKHLNVRKLVLTIPVFGAIVAINIGKDEYFREGKRLFVARGLLCGLVVGIPFVLILDLIASLTTQVRNAIQKRKAQGQYMPVV